jgi:hypothetical protein
MDEIELARALERGELPNAGFHHADHLRVAWVYLSEWRWRGWRRRSDDSPRQWASRKSIPTR